MEDSMNRKDRRAILFGNAFSLNREIYREAPYYRPFVGIDKELHDAYLEEDLNTLGWTNAQSINWMDSEIYPLR